MLILILLTCSLSSTQGHLLRRLLPSHWYHAQYIDIDIEINADVDFDIEIDIDIDIDIDADIDIEIDADVDFDIVDMLPLINSRPPP